MPFKSEKQRRWMHANEPEMADKWEKEKKDEAAERDYKDEYKKFQSSTKAKKYRAELNQYNRKKGTYGNGDGKDASHKGGKIAGFEKESTNRGRREKSRLKKESPDFNPMIDNILDEVIKEYSINEDLTKLRALYAQMDKQFKNYNHKKISDFNKVDKFLKTKFKKGSSLPDIVASFYNDYRGGEEIGKNHKRLFKYAKKMQGESVNEKMDPEQYHKYMQYVFDTQFKTPEEKKMKKSIIKKINVGQKKKGLPVFKESVNEGQKRDANNLTMEFSKSFQKFTVAVNGLAKSMTKISGIPSDQKIIMKAFKKQVIPFIKLVDSWNKGQQKNPHIKESDLGLTYKKGKTVKVKHKTSGKSLIIIDKPTVRKEYEKIGFYAEGFGGELKGSDKKKFEKARKENAEQLGYELTGKSDINESWNQIRTTLAHIVRKKQHKKIDGYLVDMNTANLILKVWDVLNSSNRKKFEKLPIKKMADVAWKMSAIRKKR